jgi:hypothetical protein
MIDSQPATTYNFAPNDTAPAAIIDLGKVTTLRRIAAIYSPQQGSIDFYILATLPGVQANRVTSPKTLRLNDNTLADLKPVGSVMDDGTGRAAIDFPSASGRYIMVKWNPAAQQETAFSIAEIVAFSGGETANLTVANTNAISGNALSDGKDVKDFGQGKEAKEVAEGPPAEGPSLTLPDPPPFVFVPEIVPTSP